MPTRRSTSSPAKRPASPSLLPPAEFDEAPTTEPSPQPAQPDSREGRRPVLVAVINNEADFQRAAQEGWYRIPQRSAPRRIGADYLAFYLTAGAGGDSVHSVAWYAATRRYRLVTRRDLLPDEPEHPRAGEAYFRIDFGPLQRLERPVPAASLRRVTFIHTTLERLWNAQDVTELFHKEDPFDLLWDSLREHKLRPLKNRLIGEEPVDIVLRARNGMLAINCRDELSAREERNTLATERWELLVLPPTQIRDDLNGCLRRIGSALLGLGGSVLNA